MIQRIQTIWLLLCAVLFGLEYWPAISFATTMTAGQPPLDDSMLKTSEDLLLSGASLISCLLSLVAVFLYRNRETQVLLAALAGLIQAGGFIGRGFYLIQRAGVFQEFRADFALYAGLAGIFLNWLATRAIRKDIEKVSGADRLR